PRLDFQSHPPNHWLVDKAHCARRRRFFRSSLRLPSKPRLRFVATPKGSKSSFYWLAPQNVLGDQLPQRNSFTPPRHRSPKKFLPRPRRPPQTLDGSVAVSPRPPKGELTLQAGTRHPLTLRAKLLSCQRPFSSRVAAASSAPRPSSVSTVRATPSRVLTTTCAANS